MKTLPKWLLAGGAAAVAIVAIGVLSSPKPVGPEAIQYGKEACGRCRMLISQPGYGGELRDRRGVLTKYDDVGCLLVAMWQAHAEFPEAWVEDHGGHGFIPLVSATFVRGDGVGTPMGYGVIAFADPAGARKFAAGNGGNVTDVEGLLRDQARFGRRPVAHVDEREEQVR